MSAVLVLRNAHHILGVPTGTNLSQIRQRGQHLLNLVKIDESESYETDIPCLNPSRTEQNIREAIERLSGVQSRFIEVFFWFEIASIQDQKCLRSLAAGKYDEAISSWTGESKSSINWLAKKNEALAAYVSTFQTANLKQFERSLELWREIAHSDNFWSFYQSHYALSDELGSSKNMFSEFRAKFPEFLSWLVLDLYRKNLDANYVRIFFSQFGTVGTGIESHILNPIVSKLRSEMENLSKVTAGSGKEALKVRTAKASVEAAIKDLSNFGVDDYSPVKALREEIALRLRSLSVDMHNDHGDISLAKDLLSASANVSTSESHKIQVERDRQQLTKNESFNTFVEDFVNRVKNKVPREKLKILREIEPTLSEEIRASDGYLGVLKSVIIEYALEEFNQGKAHLDRKNESAAEACFERAYSELVTSVDHFALNKEKVLKLADDLIKETRAISAPEHVVSVDQNIKGVRELADKVKIDEESKVALILLCNAGIHREISPYLRRLRYGAYLTQVGWLTVWFYGIGIGFWIAAFCYRRKMF